MFISRHRSVGENHLHTFSIRKTVFVSVLICRLHENKMHILFYLVTTEQEGGR